MKILIVDDEPQIRQGLRLMLEQIRVPGTAIEVAGMAEDGADAVSFLNHSHVDLVITDIRMPGMDGLQLLEWTRLRRPDVSTVILSGYDDFAYAQRAIRGGACDYWLKPVQETDVLTTLRRLSEERRPWSENIHLTLAELGDKGRCRMVVLCDVDDSSSGRAGQFGDEETVAWVLRKSSLETLRESGGYLISESNKIRPTNMVYGFAGESPAAVREQADAFVRVLTGFWAERVRIPVSFGLSECRGSEARAAALYDEAQTALLARLYLGSGVYGPPAGERGRAETELLPQLTAALDTSDLPRLTALVRAFIAEHIALHNSAVLLAAVERLLIMVHHKMQGSAGSGDTLSARTTAEFLSRLSWSQSVEQFVQSVQGRIDGVFHTFRPEEHEGQILIRAKKYIRDHLSSTLTLEDIGNACFVNRTYLSRLFKNRTGKTFIEYLTELRIEEGKSLLAEPGTKIYEVAEKLGYKDWKHFSRTFKEKTGYGPAEYRSNLGLPER